METTYTKEEGKLKATKTEEVVTSYTLEFLKSQREQILKDMARVQVELDEVDTLLDECERLGVTAVTEVLE